MTGADVSIWAKIWNTVLALAVLFFFWYLAYAWTHLDIEAIRYAGACVSMLAALLLVVLLYRRSSLQGRPLLLSLAYGVFAVCSLNHYMVYYQSIEALVQPFMFGVVLLSMWSGEKTLQGRHSLLWSALCAVLALVGTGVYAPGLSILPAIVGAQILLLRRVSLSSVLLGVFGILLGFFYIHTAHALARPGEHPAASAGDP